MDRWYVFSYREVSLLIRLKFAAQVRVVEGQGGVDREHGLLMRHDRQGLHPA